MPVAERDAYLREACADEDELARVRVLLAGAPEVDSFFGDRSDEEEDEMIGAEHEGDQVGPYKLRQKIGEGGFGTVWMAEQSEPISRMVALKVVKAGMDTKQVLARFEAERQALAMMDHSNIAKVLDAGATESGRPYFAMDLVKGIPITQFCDEQKFGPQRRLELFLDVCSAVNHAHQKGIIHRDLKPSNVMVTLIADKPVAKVIDFGIAKATQGKLTEQTLFTRFEQFVGTPVYMAPEQAAMSGVDIDTRSDIYGLGVLLYELLAGKPPFDSKTLISAGYDEMRRIIREDEPPKPSTRLTETRSAASADSKLHVPYSAFPNELDWIVMKAIEKDRARRYGTANELAMDIGRHLANEPVSAARPSATYRFRKYLRRNRGLVTSLAAVFTVLAIGVIGMTILFVEMRAQKGVAVSKGKEAKLSGEAAEHSALLLTEQRNAAAAQSEIWKLQAYRANVMRAHHLWKAEQAGQAREALENCPVKLRNWEWSWLMQLANRSELIADGLANLNGAWFTPDGKQVLTGCGDRFQLWDRISHKEVMRIDLGNVADATVAPSFTPDGKQVYLTGREASGRWDLATGEQLASFDGGVYLAFHVTPDRVLSCIIDDGEVRICNLANDDAKILRVLSLEGTSGGWVSAAKFSPDGRYIAIRKSGGRPWHRQFLYRTESGELVGAAGTYSSILAFGQGSQSWLTVGQNGLTRKSPREKTLGVANS